MSAKLFYRAAISKAKRTREMNWRILVVSLLVNETLKENKEYQLKMKQKYGQLLNDEVTDGGVLQLEIDERMKFERNSVEKTLRHRQLGNLKPCEIVWEKVVFPTILLTLFRMASGLEVSKLLRHIVIARKEEKVEKDYFGMLKNAATPDGCTRTRISSLKSNRPEKFAHFCLKVHIPLTVRSKNPSYSSVV